MSWLDAPDPATAYARLLLAGQGLDVDVPEPERPRTPIEDWATSGAMALTGRADGPPQLVAGAPATTVRGALLALSGLATAAGLDAGRRLPDERVLGERAALMGEHRNGRTSVGGATHLFDAADGLVALTLSRLDDFDSLAALVGGDLGADPFDRMTRWCRDRPADVIVERAALLGLAAGRVDSQLPAAAPFAAPPVVPPRSVDQRPLVVDLSSLWAGPLCAHLLRSIGARVIQVESSQRPDPMPVSLPPFHSLLRRGVEHVELDFKAADDLQQLGKLLGEADIVIEASRPRALAQLGLDAESIAAESGTTWLSITAYGRDQNRIGYGDDVAAATGLLGAGPVFAGDAIADPMTGTLAAVAVLAAWLTGRTGIVEVVMYDVTRAARTAMPEAEVVRDGDGWAVDDGNQLIPVSAPTARAAKR
jgi:hypothetical protein